jgi:hypothetical protein
MTVPLFLPHLPPALAVLSPRPSLPGAVLTASCILWFVSLKEALKAISKSSGCLSIARLRLASMLSRTKYEHASPSLPCPSNTPRNMLLGSPLNAGMTLNES